MSNPFNEQIYLYGPPYSGKSSAGALLAAALDLPFIDLDHEIEKQTSLLIPQIFQDSGEEGFRQRESEVLAQIIQGKPAVVALGGGALLAEENRRRVEAKGPVICLNPPVETLLERAANDSGIRPLLHVTSADLTNTSKVTERLSELLEKRALHYASFHKIINSNQSGPEALADLAQIELGRFHVRGMGNPYEVLVRVGLRNQLGEIFSGQNLHGPIALLSDLQVAQLHSDAIAQKISSAGYTVARLVFPAGEKNKTISTAAQIWQGMLDQGVERRSTLIALGGGITTDLGGYAAAAYMRGIAWVAMPTSLLGMVDASIGGKTGVDLENGKNIVGAFHPPRLVLVDPDFLNTLPEAEFNNGMAEVIKAGIIGDEVLFQLCSQGRAVTQSQLQEVIARAIAVKVKVIQNDPFESGSRAVLNLGHTLGHALEATSGYHIRHGEAIATGIVAAARIAERRGLSEVGLVEKISGALRSYNLPVDLLPTIPVQPLLEAMRKDKKRSSGVHRFVLPQRIGMVTYGNEVDEAEICTLF